MKDRIIDLALDRGRSVLLIIFGVLAFGVLARLSMPVENEPRIDIPFFVITIVHEGISPLDAARLLVMPLEVELKSVEGVREVRGMGAENLAIVSVEFTAQTDLDVALGDVREAVNRAKEELPPTAEEPIVAATATANYPLLQINLVGKGTPERTMLSLARRLRDRIEAIPDVQEVKLQGSREEFMEILVSPAGMQTYNLSVEQLLLELTRNNQLIPAGELESGSGSLSLKIPSVVDRPEDLFDLLVMVDGDTVVTLKDIASVRRTFKDRTSYSHANGEPSTSLFVHLRKQANRIETAEAVRELVDTFRPQLPNSVSMFISGDYSEFSQTQVVEMQGNIVTALLLVIIVVIPAMGFRNSLIVAFSIPVSFLLALTVLWLLGETYNFMVMFGMLLGLGMLIDGAIVVCEDADRRFSVGGGGGGGGSQASLRGCRKAHVPSCNFVYRNDTGSLCSLDVLAGRGGQLHGLSPGVGLGSTAERPSVRAGFRPRHRRHYGRTLGETRLSQCAGRYMGCRPSRSERISSALRANAFHGGASSFCDACHRPSCRLGRFRAAWITRSRGHVLQ